MNGMLNGSIPGTVHLNGHERVLTHAPIDVIKVSAQSRTSSVAGAVAGVVREHGRATVQAIGAGAVNQAVKAMAIARGYLLLDGINVIIVPSFSDVDIDGAERTAVRFVVEPR